MSDLSKYQYISDLVKDRNLDFVVVKETGKQDVPQA